jgi:hypothetical protein
VVFLLRWEYHTFACIKTNASNMEENRLRKEEEMAEWSLPTVLALAVLTLVVGLVGNLMF